MPTFLPVITTERVCPPSASSLGCSVCAWAAPRHASWQATAIKLRRSLGCCFKTDCIQNSRGYCKKSTIAEQALRNNLWKVSPFSVEHDSVKSGCVSLMTSCHLATRNHDLVSKTSIAN